MTVSHSPDTARRFANRPTGEVRLPNEIAASDFDRLMRLRAWRFEDHGRPELQAEANAPGFHRRPMVPGACMVFDDPAPDRRVAGG